MKREESSELCSGHVNHGLALGDNAPPPDGGRVVHEQVQNAVVKGTAGSVVAADSVDVEDTAPDGGWGWVVAWAGFVIWVRLKECETKHFKFVL